MMRFRGWFLIGLLLLIASACGNSAEIPDNHDIQQSTPETAYPATADSAEIALASPTEKAISTAVPTEPTPTPCSEPGQLITSEYESVVEGPLRSYRIWLPPCYGQTGQLYPTIYLLHGNLRAEWEWEEVGMLASAEALIQAGDIPPVIIVMPDGRFASVTTSGGPNSFEQIIVDELMPHIEATYCAANHPRLRAIGGISRGGYWSLEIAFRHPHLFASVGGHAATLLDISASTELDPQYTAVNNDLGRLRIYLDIGENDAAIGNTLLLHEELEAAGVPHMWLLNAGGHADPYWSDHVEEYLRWYTTPWQGLDVSVTRCDRPITAEEVGEYPN